MPHKHKRDKSENNSSSDLPPTTIAAPLPVSKSSTTTSIFTAPAPASKKSSTKRKRPRDATDDTPRAFARLMAWTTTGAKPPNGLDNGARPTKKKRNLATSTTRATAAHNPGVKAISTATAPPTILPGERMSDFSARVNAALPIAGLITKSKKVVGVKERKTKTEKRMQRMQTEWREVEARRKEKAEQARDEAFVEDSDHDERVAKVGTAGPGMGKGKKRRKARRAGEDSDGEDPWAGVAATRNEASVNKGLVGLHDVVQAPPQFSKPPTERFKVRDGAGARVEDVPARAGSLRRREELGEARRGVVERYRRVMGGRREGVRVGG